MERKKKSSEGGFGLDLGSTIKEILAKNFIKVGCYTQSIQYAITANLNT